MGIELNGLSIGILILFFSTVSGVISSFVLNNYRDAAKIKKAEKEAEEKRINAWHTGRRKIEIEIDNTKCTLSSVRAYQQEHREKIHKVNLDYQYFDMTVDREGRVKVNDDFRKDPFKMFYANWWNEQALEKKLIALRKKHDSY